VGVPVPPGDRGHAPPAAGGPRAGDTGPVVEGAAAAARDQSCFISRTTVLRPRGTRSALLSRS
jgi:hypothetical protein